MKLKHRKGIRFPGLSNRFPGASATVVVFRYCKLHFSGSFLFLLLLCIHLDRINETTNAMPSLQFLDIRLCPIKRGRFLLQRSLDIFLCDFVIAILFNMTLDADGYSSRVTSRGVFRENSERFLQKTMVVSQAQSCSEYDISIQVRPQGYLSPPLPSK